LLDFSVFSSSSSFFFRSSGSKSDVAHPVGGARRQVLLLLLPQQFFCLAIVNGPLEDERIWGKKLFLLFENKKMKFK
jgi:hypothetical protein